MKQLGRLAPPQLESNSALAGARDEPCARPRHSPSGGTEVEMAGTTGDTIGFGDAITSRRALA